MKNLLLTVILIVNTWYSYGREDLIYYTSSDFLRNSSQTNILKLNPGLEPTKYLKIKRKDNTITHILKANVWGWKYMGTCYRYDVNEREALSIIKTKDIFIYRGHKNTKYFSETADSPIYRLTYKKLKQVVGEERYEHLKEEYKRYL